MSSRIKSSYPETNLSHLDKTKIQLAIYSKIQLTALFSKLLNVTYILPIYAYFTLTAS